MSALPGVGRPLRPTRGGPDHRAESELFCAAFPDNKVKHPYDILFADGEYTAFVTDALTPIREDRSW
jgi:hypothetical protein